MTVKLKGITLPAGLNYPKLDTFKLFDVMANPPITAGLVGSYFLGSKNADPLYNFANPAKPLISKMSPDTSNSKYATLSTHSGYFDTGLPSSTTMTVVALVKQRPIPTASPVVSSYFKDTSGGVTGETLLARWVDVSGVQTTQSTFYAQFANPGVQNGSLLMPDVVASQFVVVGGIVTTEPKAGAWGLSETTGPAFGASALMSGRTLSNKTLLIGATYSDSEFLAGADVSAVLIYSNDIGGTNMQNTMKWLRNVVGVQAGIWTAPKP